MEIKTGKSNIISNVKGVDGATKYVVNLGTILYNNTFIELNNLVIPIFSQQFFEIPKDSNKFAVINVYYKIETGIFVFDNVGIFNNKVTSISYEVIPNHIPIAQFILQQKNKTFEVIAINPYSQMSTYAVSEEFIKGATGAKGNVGTTGIIGTTGIRGETGPIGDTGVEGLQGNTGVGLTGCTGIQGCTGWFPDPDLQFYLKLKNSDEVQVDYSIYERDLQWDVGITGESFYTLESGIVDGCLYIQFQGSPSKFNRNQYIGLTGAGIVAAWVRVDVKPISNFTYTIDSINPLKVKMYDTSTYFPTGWLWNFGDTYTSNTKNTDHIYTTSGTYLVSLTTTNLTGSDTFSQYITV
jgi:PKD repeat protein